jgi:predicted NUDIX family phosphoesterase
MERVMVVPAETLAPYLEKKGFLCGPDTALLRLVQERHLFLPRDKAELDPSHKQIIPYVVLCRGGEVYLLRRLKKGGEERLHGLLSLGAGGHIEESDEGGDVLRSGMERELNEELSLTHPGEERFLGVINDDTNSVGSVHLGLCFTMEVSDAAVRETEKLAGEWVRREALHALSEQMESWSQLILEALTCSADIQ